MKNIEHENRTFQTESMAASPTIHGEEMKYIQQAYDTNWMSTVGANINEVERIAAEKAERKYSVALSNCTAALHLCVKLAGEKLYGKSAISHGALEGKRVFCSDMTFDATLNPVIYEGGIPVFIDTEADSWNMDLGAHPMYLLNWFMGKPKAVSSAFTNCVVQSVEDNAVSLLEYENGAIGVSETAFVSPSPFSFDISGLKGTILAGGADHTVRYNIGDGWVVPALPERLPQPIDAWIDAIETGVSVPYSIDDAVALTQIMEAAYIASNERRKVMIL